MRVILSKAQLFIGQADLNADWRKTTLNRRVVALDLWRILMTTFRRLLQNFRAGSF